MNGATQLEVIYDWRERRLAQRLLERRETLTFGTGATAALVAPRGAGRSPGPRSLAAQDAASAAAPGGTACASCRR
jgi:hypothetical protein